MTERSHGPADDAPPSQRATPPPRDLGTLPQRIARRVTRMDRCRLLALAALLIVVLGWALLPAARGLLLIENLRHTEAPALPTDLPAHAIRFSATDGVALAGWLVVVSPQAPTVILAHGFKGSRADMLPWARFLAAAGYNSLLFDERGCGQSDGWAITLGAREPEDILGAVAYLRGRADLPVKRYGVLGVSLGAGAALLAAAREPGILATVADSAWPDEQPQLTRMASLRVGPLALPLPPYEPALVDALIGARLEETRPLAVIRQIAPRAVLLIASADDANRLTPLTGERALYAAASPPKAEWIAPSGGHAGALAAHPSDYQRVVLAFLAAHLK